MIKDDVFVNINQTTSISLRDFNDFDDICDEMRERERERGRQTYLCILHL